MALHSMDPAWTKNPLVLLWVAWLLCLPQLFFFLIICWLIYLTFFPFCILSSLYLLLKVREFEDHTYKVCSYPCIFYLCAHICWHCVWFDLFHLLNHVSVYENTFLGAWKLIESVSYQTEVVFHVSWWRESSRHFICYQCFGVCLCHGFRWHFYCPMDGNPCHVAWFCHCYLCTIVVFIHILNWLFNIYF